MFRVSGVSLGGNLEKIVADEGVFSDPDNDLTRFLLYIYSMESFIPSEIKRIQLQKDVSCMPALGPFAMCLESILYGANESKKKKIMGQNNEQIEELP